MKLLHDEMADWHKLDRVLSFSFMTSLNCSREGHLAPAYRNESELNSHLASSWEQPNLLFQGVYYLGISWRGTCPLMWRSVYLVQRRTYATTPSLMSSCSAATKLSNKDMLTPVTRLMLDIQHDELAPQPCLPSAASSLTLSK